jgi:hypothetical protein
MRLVVALVIALLPAGAFAQAAANGLGQGGSTSNTSTYGGGSSYGTGNSGYDGGGIDSATAVEPRSKVRAPPPNMGGNYGYGDKSKAAPPQ